MATSSKPNHNISTKHVFFFSMDLFLSTRPQWLHQWLALFRYLKEGNATRPAEITEKGWKTWENCQSLKKSWLIYKFVTHDMYWMSFIFVFTFGLCWLDTTIIDLRRVYKAEGWSCVWCILDFGDEDHVWDCFAFSILHARIIWDIFNPTLLVPNLKRTCRKNKIVFMICSWLQCWFSVSPMAEVFAVMLQGESGQLFKLQMLWRYLSEVARLSIHFLDFISTITLTSSVLGHGWFMPGPAYFCFRSSGYLDEC